MEEFKKACCFHGYHVYKEAWKVAVGKGLDCEREPNNPHDHYVVAVKREVVIDHLPQKLLRLCSFILGFEIHQNGLEDYFTP